MPNKDTVCASCNREQMPAVAANQQLPSNQSTAGEQEERRIEENLDHTVRIAVIAIVIVIPVLSYFAFGPVGAYFGLAFSVVLLACSDGFL